MLTRLQRYRNSQHRPATIECEMECDGGWKFHCQAYPRPIYEHSAKRSCDLDKNKININKYVYTYYIKNKIKKYISTYL